MANTPRLGVCRIEDRDFSRRRRRPERNNDIFLHLTPGPLLLHDASSDRTILGRHSYPLTLRRNSSGTILKFDPSIQIKTSESFSWKNILQHTLAVTFSDDEQEPTTLTANKPIKMNIHPTFQDDLVQTFLGVFESTPSPISSLFLRLKSCEPPWDRSIEEIPLLLSCLKRNLVGSLILWQEGMVTTLFKFNFLEKAWRMEVESSIIPSSHPHETPNCAIVLPSTRITIRDQTHQVPIESCTTQVQSTLSPTANLLIDIIADIRRFPTANLARSFLLSGPPGSGKTFAVRTVHQHTSCELITINGSELLGKGHFAEACLALERSFHRAHLLSERDQQSVTVVFLDECDALVATEPLAAMFAVLLDQVSTAWTRVMVVGATNRIDSIPASLRRAGRFDRELPLAPPNAQDRASILSNLLLEYGEEGSLPDKEIQEIANLCVGYVPADLSALVRRAAILTLDRDIQHISKAIFEEAMDDVGASALRDTIITAPPSTKWSDIAGDPGGAKTALQQAIEWPRERAHSYKALGLTPPRGIILYGPPGCSKTTLARAAAGASGVAFLSLAPADVYASSYVGDAESVIRRSFTLARSAAPCVLFFDEIDSILGSDGVGGMQMKRGVGAEARVLSTFLNEMDGVDGSSKDGVLVLGATNRPWTLDAALLRPGRFDKSIFVPPPDYEGRRSILLMQLRNAMESDLDLNTLVARTENMTGAEIVGACREASMNAIRVAVETGYREIPKLTQDYIETALSKVKPLLSSPKVMEEFRKFEEERMVG